MAWGLSSAPRPHRREKPCWRCGYSLRHLPGESRNCPECGLAVRISLSDDRSLHMADPQWLARLATGAVLIAAAFVPPALLLSIAGIVEMGFGARAVQAIAFALSASAGLMLAGWWLLSIPPSYGAMEIEEKPTLIARVLVTVLLATAVLTVIIHALRAFPGLPMIIGGFGAFVLVQVVHLAILFRLQTLLQRQLHRRLKLANRVALWGSVALLAFPCLSGTMFGPLLDMLEHSGGRVVSRLAVLTLLGGLVLFWLRMALEFRRLRSEAEAAWCTD